MGFFLRKSFSFGPLRINLSKSGLGLSFGVTGLRLGIKPNGQKYVHAGRYGIYYRKSLGRKQMPVPKARLVGQVPVLDVDFPVAERNNRRNTPDFPESAEAELLAFLDNLR